MKRFRWVWMPAALLAISACGLGSVACQISPGDEEQASTEAALVVPQADQGLVIENDSELPETYPHGPYQVRLVARGGVPPLHWRVEAGTLPPGIKLEDDGLLHGEAERPGEFQFTVSLRDSSQAAVQKRFVILVRTALVINWKSPAHVTGSRIEGSVEVTNTTPDDMDLTFDVKAVAENGRATEIGYQHFVLRRGTMAKELPFGETLPHGGYVVHVNAVGEVAAKKLIYRARMQTDRALQVTVGP